MKRYEVVFILRADLSEEDSKAIVTNFLEVVAKKGGVVSKVERWGNKKLAYLIKKQSRGDYTLIEVISESPAVKELERLFRIEERVLRYMVVATQEDVSQDEILAASQAEVALDGSPDGQQEEVGVQQPEEVAADTEIEPEVVAAPSVSQASEVNASIMGENNNG